MRPLSSHEAIGVLAPLSQAVCMRLPLVVLPPDARVCLRPVDCPDPSRCEEALSDVRYRLVRRKAGRHREIEQPGYGHNLHGRGDTQRKD